MGSHMSNEARRRRRRVALAGLVAAQVAAGVGWAGAAHAAPSTARVSINSAGQQGNGPSGGAVVNSDGNYIAFSSNATNLAGGITTGQVYLRDKIRGVTELVSKAVGGPLPNGRALDPDISDDGRFIAFQSFASNLVSGDTNGVDDVFVKDQVAGTVKRVSVSSSGSQGNDTSFQPAISGDGRYIAYGSRASNLVSGDTNGVADIFVHDRVFGTTTRASVGTTGVQSNRDSSNPSLSRDGAKVAFDSPASNLIAGADTNGTTDVFVASRTGVILRASQSSFGQEGNSSSRNAAISGDGRAVAYESSASNLVSGDTNGRRDVFHHDLITRLTNRVVNGRNSGLINDPGNGDSGGAAISHTGRIVAFHSAATNLVSADPNGAVLDVFVANLDRPLGAQNTLASVSTAGAAANGASAIPDLSSNNQVVTFHSQASNLVAGDTNGTLDAFARTLQ
jgi:WD40-like Beta Propeller Repeat